MIMWIMSDRAIPRSFRLMEGFGVHTFRLLDRHELHRWSLGRFANRFSIGGIIF